MTEIGDERQRLDFADEARRVIASTNAQTNPLAKLWAQRYVDEIDRLNGTVRPPSEGNKKGEERLTAWLIELPQVVTQSETLEPRWWHPRDGWTGNPNHAVRFARREDAWTYIHHAHQSDAFGFRSAVPAEHIWIGSSALASRHEAKS